MHSMKANRSVGGGDALERGILVMTAGFTPLLKFGEGGKPGFRPFQLSSDLMALTWQSKNKAANKTKVYIKDMKEIRYGQRTDKFKKNNRPDLENLSFSIMYVEKGTQESLDLVCKDESEFQIWTGTLSTLIDGKTDLTQYLLAIQKRQLEAQSRGEGAEGSSREGQKAVLKSKGHGHGGFRKENEANDVYAFGWGLWGQNGQGLQENMEACPVPKLLESLLGKHVVQVAQGWSHAAVLLESGEMLQYGNRIGTGLNEDFVFPTLTPLHGLSEKANIVSLACGAFHSAALTDRGHVLTWGCGIQGQLGHGDTRDVKEPRFVETLRAPQGGSTAPAAEPVFVSALVCGGSITAALSDEGGVWTWGSGSYGALGHNDVSDRLQPTRVSDLKGIEVQKLAAGDAHMFACTAREIYAWGWNQSSQCGLGHEEDQHRPHVIESLRGTEVKEISAGATHSFALVHIAKMRSDILFSWGSNAMGQCGQGKKTKLARPTPVPELRTTGATGSSVDSPVVEVRCGANHTILRTSNGEVLATGSNRYGQCGLSASGSGKAAAGAGASHPAQVDEFHCVDFLKDKIARSLCCGGENSSVLTARAWVEDSEATECMACKAPFTFVNRKHHCRNCGGIFCGACSSKKIAILRIQVTEPVRVCNSCFTMLGGR